MYRKIVFLLVVAALFAGCDSKTKRVTSTTISDTTPPQLILSGDKNITIPFGKSYIEAGFEAIDDIDGDITDKVNITGVVDISKVGKYTLNYSVSDSSGNKSSQERVINIVDKIAPNLTLNGGKNLTIPLNSNFTEPGFSAIDNADGNITNNVVITGSVDTTKVGVYNLEYSIKDSSNNSKSALREVKVTTFANAKLGALADAKVDIYKFNSNGTLEYLWSEQTTNASNLEDIGKFNTHAYELEDSALYLYKVSGGKDYDSNNDGIKDADYTLNLGSISAIATKESVLNCQNNFNVTLLSQIAYELAKRDIKYNYSASQILEELNDISMHLIGKEYAELLKFNATTDLEQLKIFKDSYSHYVDLIHEKKSVIANLTKSLTTIKTKDFARSITPSKDSNLLYIADGNEGIALISKKDKSKLSSIKTKDFARKIALNSSESIAYVADSKAGFSVVNLDTKEVIANIPTYESDSEGDFDARYVELSEDGNIAYVAASKKGVMVIDISTPLEPKVLKVIDTPDIAYKVELLDSTRALVADGKTGLLVINLETNETISKVNTYGSANSFTIDLENSKVYIADGYKGVVVVSLDKDAGTIKYKAHVNTSDFATKIVLNTNKTLAYVADKKGNIQVIDLTLDYPEVIDSISTPYRSYDLVLSNNESVAYVASGTNGVEVVSLNSITNPAILSSVKSDYRAYSAVKKGNFLFVSQGYKGLQIIDATNLEELKPIASIDTDGFALQGTIDGNNLYIADGYKGLQVVDISSPADASIIKNLDTNGFTTDVKQIPNSKNLLISDGKEGVKLIDTDSLISVASLKTSDKAGKITLSNDGKKAYVTVGKKGVDIIDVKADTLSKVSNIDLAKYVSTILLNSDETVAYIGTDSGVEIYDFANSKSIATIDTKAYVNKLALSKDKKYLYIADNSYKLLIVELKENRVIAKVELNGIAKDILIDNDIAYVSTYKAGVVAIDLELLR
jgi:hypothetical protein